MTKFLINGIWYESVLEDNGIAVLQDMYGCTLTIPVKDLWKYME
ncbi:hypothetical protein [Fusobacterium nucleatum]|jgi:hypothetical protein|nr:hypothetical protein [Fusobacterium nucleatum]